MKKLLFLMLLTWLIPPGVMSKGRFSYWPPRGLTEPFKPKAFQGGDEWGNSSMALMTPIGGFIFFYGRRFSRDGDPF